MSEIFPRAESQPETQSEGISMEENAIDAVFPGIESGQYRIYVDEVANEVEVVDGSGKSVLLIDDAIEFADAWTKRLLARKNSISPEEFLFCLNKVLPAVNRGEYKPEIIDKGENVRIRDAQGKILFFGDTKLFAEISTIRSICDSVKEPDPVSEN